MDTIEKEPKKMTPKNRGLGRGLNALFDDEESQTVIPSATANAPAAPASSSARPEGAGKKTLGIDMLRPGKFQPRTVFNEETLKELSESIKTHGLLQPIVVRPVNAQADLYEIIAGERRWRASQLAGLHDVPVIIREMNDQEALEIALVENLQREDLNPIDEALGYKRLMDEFQHTQEQLAEALGKSRSHVANMVRLLVLPEIVLMHLERGDISMGHARALITAKDPGKLVREIVEKNLSVRQTEKMAGENSTRDKKKTRFTVVPKGKDVDTLAVEKDLENALGMKVSIDSKDGKAGTISVEFKSLDQLDVVIKRLAFANIN